MGEFDRQMSREEINFVLQHYDLPPITDFEIGGGTASPKVVLTTGDGRLLLKRRRREFSAPEVVAFDHSVLRHLDASGVPVPCPIPARTGATAVFFRGWAFEIRPYVEDIAPFDQESSAQVRSAARTLALIHECTAEFQPEGRKDWTREFHAGVNARTLRDCLSGWEDACHDAEKLILARRMLDLLADASEELTDERVAALPQCIVHGDYMSANVFFRRNKVAAVFDFDWTYRQARMDDVARGILFFAFRRREPIDGGSIWSLMQAWTPDVGRARLFIKSYGRRVGLTREERACLPWFLRETALSMRVRAMRKVAEGRKLEMLTFDMGPVMAWLEGEAEGVAD